MRCPGALSPEEPVMTEQPLAQALQEIRVPSVLLPRPALGAGEPEAAVGQCLEAANRQRHVGMAGQRVHDGGGLRNH